MPARRAASDEGASVRRRSRGDRDAHEQDGEDREVYEQDEEDPDEQESRSRPAGSKQPERRSRRVTAAQAAQAGVRGLTDLIGKKPEGVTAVEPADDGGWVIGVEVVEDQRVPSSADILAIYEADLDSGGNLMSYRRTSRYARGRGEPAKES